MSRLLKKIIQGKMEAKMEPQSKQQPKQQMPQVDTDNIDEFIDEVKICLISWNLKLTLKIKIKLHLASEQCHVNIFACVYNPFTKIKKSTNSFTHAETLKLAQLLPLAFRRFEAKKGFKSELYAIALQDVIWKVFDYEKLRKEVHHFHHREIMDENEIEK